MLNLVFLAAGMYLVYALRKRKAEVDVSDMHSVPMFDLAFNKAGPVGAKQQKYGGAGAQGLGSNKPTNPDAIKDSRIHPGR